MSNLTISILGMLNKKIRIATAFCPWLFEDALSEAILASVMAERTWKPELGKFITYGGKAGLRAGWRYILKELKRGHVATDYESVASPEIDEDYEERRKAAFVICWRLQVRLTRHEYLCLLLRHGFGLSLREIGFVIERTPERAAQLISSGEDACWTMFETRFLFPPTEKLPSSTTSPNTSCGG